MTGGPLGDAADLDAPACCPICGCPLEHVWVSRRPVQLSDTFADFLVPIPEKTRWRIRCTGGHRVHLADGDFGRRNFRQLRDLLRGVKGRDLRGRQVKLSCRVR